MASVMQGDAYNIPVTIKSGNGTLITPEIAACVEITVGQFTKRWPGQVTFDEKTGEWQFPVTQKQTFRFAPGAAVVQARVVFQDGSIMGGSGAPICVEQSASRGTLPQPEKAEAVTGSAPKATEVTIPTVHDIDVSLHSQVILSDPIKAPYIGDNGNWYEYDAATGTFVDTGTSASGTPPITPDTAGKYLTNDGSKAEWGARVVENIKRFDTNELLLLAGSGVTAIVKEEGNANSGDMVFPVIVQRYGIISHGTGTMHYVDAHGDNYSGSFSLIGNSLSIPKLVFSSTTLYVTITQDGQDSSGNPIYKSDKTYAEIKAAHDAGREVKAVLGGIVPEILFLLGISDLPLNEMSDDEAIFSCAGIPPIVIEQLIGSANRIGGQAISIVKINVLKDGNVSVLFPLDSESGESWDKRFVNKLPQQYLATVSMTAGGELSSTTTFDDLKSIYEAYQAFEAPTGIAALCTQISFPNGVISPIHRMVNFDGTTFVFQAVSADDLNTITLTKNGDKDVWKYEATPFSKDNLFIVTLTDKTGGGYDKDKTFAEIKAAVNGGKIVFAVHSSLYEKGFYLLTDIVEVGSQGVKRLTFTGEYSTLVFYSEGGSEPTYNKGWSSNGSLVRSNSSYPPSMIKGNGHIFERAEPNKDYMAPVPVTTADNGKFLRVLDGSWAAEAVANAKGVSF